MAKKHAEGYLSAKEARQISRNNRRITNKYEKLHKRKNVPESEYLTTMKDPKNVLEIENLKKEKKAGSGQNNRRSEQHAGKQNNVGNNVNSVNSGNNTQR